MINPTLPDNRIRLSATSAYSHTARGLIEPSSSSCPLASTVGIISTTSLRLHGRPPRPTGPLLQKGYVVPFLIALMTRSASLDDSRRFPTLWLYGGSLPDDLVWAAPETFPAFGQHSFPTCHHPYAGRRAGGMCPVFPQPQWPSPFLKWVGSCIYPDTDSRRGSLNDAAMFALCCGPQSC